MRWKWLDRRERSPSLSRILGVGWKGGLCRTGFFGSALQTSHEPCLDGGRSSRVLTLTDATEHTFILCCTTSKLPRLTQKVKKNFKKKYILKASKKNISLYDCTTSLIDYFICSTLFFFFLNLLFFFSRPSDN